MLVTIKDSLPKQQTGGVLAEFAITLPFLITFLILTIEFARPALNAIKWIMATQMTVQAGAKSNLNNSANIMNHTFNLFANLSSTGDVTPSKLLHPTSFYARSGGTGLPMVKAQTNATIDPLLNTSFLKQSLGVGADLVFPSLIVTANIGNANQFANPNCTYSCLGACGGGGICVPIVAVRSSYGQAGPIFTTGSNPSDDYRDNTTNNENTVVGNI